jgi:sirohydrochlorin ferrochelatase
VSEPRIVTPDEAISWRDGTMPEGSFVTMDDFVATIATEPDRTRAAVLEALRESAAHLQKEADHAFATYADAVDNDTEAIELDRTRAAVAEAIGRVAKVLNEDNRRDQAHSVAALGAHMPKVQSFIGNLWRALGADAQVKTVITTTTTKRTAMTKYNVLTTQTDEPDEITALYYVVEDGLVTFKDEDHKQVASYNLSHFVSAAKS